MNLKILLVLTVALVGISAVGVSYGANIQPEAIASAYRYSGDLDVFTLSSNDVTVSCPSDEKRTTLYSETKKYKFLQFIIPGMSMATHSQSLNFLAIVLMLLKDIPCM